MKLNVRSAEEVVADVCTWPARLAAILGDATPAELEYLAGESALYSQHLEAVEAAVSRRRQERQEADARELALALKGRRAKESKGPGRQPGALHEGLTHTGPHPEGSYARRT